MAVQPKPAPKPEPHPQPQPKPEGGEAAKAAPSLRPDGPTIADQQRESSAKIEAEGMSRYMDEHDERPADERGGSKKQVPGVTPPTKRE